MLSLCARAVGCTRALRQLHAHRRESMIAAAARRLRAQKDEELPGWCAGRRCRRLQRKCPSCALLTILEALLMNAAPY